jgi:hypothetical protein
LLNAAHMVEAAWPDPAASIDAIGALPSPLRTSTVGVGESLA